MFSNQQSDDSAPPAGSIMSCEQALESLSARRSERQIVISNQMTARIWPGISQHPLDFNYLSSTMGGAVPLGLGLALAQPDYDVIVLSGDGSLLMNLGCLATVVASGAANITIIVMDNGLYEVTGGQQTPGRQANVNYAMLSQATGFRCSRSFGCSADWQEFLDSDWPPSGPALISLRVHPVESATPRHTGTKVDIELKRLRKHLKNRLQTRE